MEPQTFPMGDVGQRVDVVVCTANGCCCGGDDAQRPHALFSRQCDLFFKTVWAHATVNIALDLDDVLVANADDVGGHEHRVMGLCRHEDYG